jgi:ABC-2 type transport system ATP-binding protein
VTNGGSVPALEFAGLTKRFGENVAVDHIDLVVPPGSFFGLVGPNGAGKTTSLSMAVGLLRPTAARRRSSAGKCGPTRSPRRR